MSFAPTSRSHSAAQSYAKVGVETGVAAADSHRLILMLFDGALLAVAKAGSAMEQKRIAEKGQIISHAIDIIANGLKASLNFAAGDELANRLAALYDYMCNRLLYANLKNDAAALNEVGRLLAELRSAWVEIAQDPAVASASKAAA
ncbi:MAG: flagellar export chaperone FliS [Sulfuritalea sp.]|jgi:flagellar protein FliS|nr:flagellar export chaperone FliS [Azonexus sp.]MCC7310414.1 flagellar export chaperone FliS [Sulfuritalea sp.]